MHNDEGDDVEGDVDEWENNRIQLQKTKKVGDDQINSMAGGGSF